MSAQDRTLDQYQKWLNVNAVSHLIHASRRLGILQALEDGQRTATQLCESLSLRPEPTGLLLDAIVAIGIIEQYRDAIEGSIAILHIVDRNRLICRFPHADDGTV